MFNSRGRVVQTPVANRAETECESSPYLFSEPRVCTQERPPENHFVSKVGAPETEQLVPTQTEATISTRGRSNRSPSTNHIPIQNVMPKVFRNHIISEYGTPSEQNRVFRKHIISEYRPSSEQNRVFRNLIRSEYKISSEQNRVFRNHKT